MSIDLTKITTPYGLLDEIVQDQLRSHGGPYEWFASGGWQHVMIAGFEWHMVYRVKPKPIVVRSALDAWLMPTGWVHAGKSMQEASPVRIIFETVDGVIDPSSYRVVPR